MNGRDYVNGSFSSSTDRDCYVFPGMSNNKQSLRFYNYSQSPYNYLQYSVFRYSDLINGKPPIVEKVVAPASDLKTELSLDYFRWAPPTQSPQLGRVHSFPNENKPAFNASVKAFLPLPPGKIRLLGESN
ncbi:hypothetical protein [Paenibacillus jilunlii]|uniref:hypothetical protein n=1 Tax=Paenibacillus jilunlii TaxID=682956 RepID=UPI0012F894FC|nr:hypothetical protein [Paenibacillus jilunlii]